MKNRNVIALFCVLGTALTACNSGGSSSSSGSGSSSSTTDTTSTTQATGYLYGTNGDLVYNYGGGTALDQTTGDFLISEGGNEFLDPSNGQIIFSYSNGSGTTKDVDLQQADAQNMDLDSRAEAISDKFQMSFESARQLTELSDKMKQMSAQGKMTAEDRAAITKSAFSIAGVTPDEVNNAVSDSLKGDDRASDALMEKAAHSMGMPSGAIVRDQLLPSFGINVN